MTTKNFIKEYLKRLQEEGYQYVTSDMNGTHYAHKTKPEKSFYLWLEKGTFPKELPLIRKLTNFKAFEPLLIDDVLTRKKEILNHE